jgi:FAD dependent oxidoreductase TIGR03364
MIKTADLVVVGAGMLGTAHAYHALKMGYAVTLLEKDNAPQEATVRNFGQIVPSGMPSGKWQEYGMQSLRFYQEIHHDFDIAIRNNGSYYIASNNQEIQLIEELYDKQTKTGYTAQLLTTAECLDRFPTLKKDYCRGALYFSKELSAEPRQTIHRIIQYLQHKFPNFTYCPNTAVIACSSDQGRATIETATGTKYLAEQIIICSGREFKLLYPEVFAASDIEVSRLQMMQTFPLPQVVLPGNILTGLTIRRYESFQECPSYSALDNSDYDPAFIANGIHILFKQALDGSIIVGDSHAYAPVNSSDAVGFDIDTAVNELMLREAARIIELPDWRMQTYWNGYYAQMKNGDILHHAIDDHIQIITGIGGKGMTTSLGFAADSIQRTFNKNA